MQQLSRSGYDPSRRLIRRLDRVFGEINVVLLALAIGLAVLDLTCFVAQNAFEVIRRASISTGLNATERSLDGFARSQAKSDLVDQ